MIADPDLIARVCRGAADRPGDVRHVVAAEVDRLAPLATDTERRDVVDAAVARLAGLDLLERHLADDQVDEVIVNRGVEVWVERHGSLSHVDDLPPGAVDVVLQRILAPTGRRLDRSSPIIDTRLPDGSRVCAAVAPVAVDGTVVAIRRHRLRRVPLDRFADRDVADVVRRLVERRANVMVTGATSSGKTTLLASSLALVPARERLVVIEDTAELDLADHHLVRLESRPATADGVREIAAAELVRAALRLRPDRLIVGEFRGDEALAVVQALNTGHDGSWATCHANSALDGLRRLVGLVLQAAPAWPMAAIRHQVSRSIDAIVHVERRAGTRRITEIVEPDEHGDEPTGRHLVADGAVVCPTEVAR